MKKEFKLDGWAYVLAYIPFVIGMIMFIIQLSKGVLDINYLLIVAILLLVISNCELIKGDK